MYGHGLCAITLCEAYAMTQDPKLQRPAQRALDYIVFAQDPYGGGWRYEVKQPGDTSVVGWQLMALKSGHMASLHVPASTINLVSKFLDSVQTNKGATYGYTSPDTLPGTTAVGLLSRMYLGWKQNNPALAQGVDVLSELGPSKEDMYFNYYATQVMRHYEGKAWKKWNPVMRDWLIKNQSEIGHEFGSWHIDGPHSDYGGRLYNTSMATMILEVYYRHLPLYQKKASDIEF